MAVGTTPIVNYEGERISWLFTFTDPTGNVTTISGWTIQTVVKVSAAALNPPLLGPPNLVSTVVSASSPMTFKVEGLLDLDPGAFVVSSRRTNDPPGPWQLVHCPLTIVDSASVD